MHGMARVRIRERLRSVLGLGFSVKTRVRIGVIKPATIVQFYCVATQLTTTALIYTVFSIIDAATLS